MRGYGLYAQADENALRVCLSDQCRAQNRVQRFKNASIVMMVRPCCKGIGLPRCGYLAGDSHSGKISFPYLDRRSSIAGRPSYAIEAPAVASSVDKWVCTRSPA